jgi:hypothetical protein
MHDQGQAAVELQYEQLPAPANPQKPLALDRRQRRIERLQRVDARGQRRLDLRAGERGVEQPCRDLNLR